MSLEPGTRSRTSTPSSAAARSACTYGGVPAKYASVIHSDRRAALAMNWSRRKQPGGPRLVADDPEPRVPDGADLDPPPPLVLGDGSPDRGPDPGEGVLDVRHRRTLDLHPGVPPGRDALRRIPDQASPTHSPETNATRPSTLTVLR